MYQDVNACINFVWCISVVFQKKIICKVRNSPFFGFVIDESTDIGVTSYFVMFTMIIEEGPFATIF